ncbi:hypothetical protein R3P38DRAFT_2716808 [Favolaschia claudopus]|uniref:F-box domain-containing protein n=1 Tax=Favolaschia claudopus TaxID=2862362 RepID=A0AAW0AV12_9AGAR
MALPLLPEELILIICSELCVEDILRLRQTCRVLSTATRTKLLWSYVLRRHEYMHGNLLSYLGGYDRLEAFALETLACRVARLDAKWKARDLSPVRDYQLRLPQSITWLRLVAGTWLFVASSDNYISKLTCWDVHSIIRGHHEPLAEAYLPGQVKTGQLEVQDSGIVLALGLGPESQTVHVITFRKGSDGHVFSELARVDGSSHVLMLAGDVLGCALRAGTIVPHLVNWKENKIHIIPQSDVPGERSVPHLMAIRKNTLVLVRAESLQVYTLPSVAKDHVDLVKRADVPAIWEAVVSTSPAEPSILRLLILSAVGIEMCLIDVDVLTEIDDEPICPRFTVTTQPRYRHSYPAPWYRLCGGSRQCLWLSASETTRMAGPHFKTVPIPLQPPTEEVPPIAWSQDGPEQSALWALSIFDIDDILGVTVVGNCFGELSIYDHVGNHPAQSEELTFDLPRGESPIISDLPMVPIPLNLSYTPRNRETSFVEANPAVLSKWTQDPIDLGYHWRRDWWDHEECSGYRCCDEWEGVLCDLAWKVEHAYGFSGSIVPQAWLYNKWHLVQRLLFRLGDRYLVYTADAPHGSGMELMSYPVYPSNRNRFFDECDAETERCTRLTATTEAEMYQRLCDIETSEGAQRNRWAEQAERGGRPHPNLLVIPPLFQHYLELIDSP